MHDNFLELLAVGGKSNSLGKVTDVIQLILDDESRLDELYDCLFAEDAWVRMRAADALEKICRVHPDWLLPYIDRFVKELSSNPQASIQWHLAQIYAQVELTSEQKKFAIDWLARILSTKEVDWIVAANAMDTLVQFTSDGSFPKLKLIPLLKVQQHHKSNAVIKRANKHIEQFSD
jgi:hypothetical protein